MDEQGRQIQNLSRAADTLATPLQSYILISVLLHKLKLFDQQ